MKESLLSFKEKTTQAWFTFKLLASTVTLLRLTRYILFLMISVYDYFAIRTSSFFNMCVSELPV